VLNILAANDGDNFHTINVLNSVENAVGAANASAVSLANKINRLIVQGVPGNLLELLEKGVVVFIGLSLSKMLKFSKIDAL